MSPKPLKAFILAAGFGNRLRPLTENVPKPLIPFFSITPLELLLMRLQKQTQIKNVAINLHYLAGKMQDFIDELNAEKSFSLQFFVSHEKHEILGTGGCYNPILSWLEDSHLLTANADVVSDINFKKLIALHFAKANNIATCVTLNHWKPQTNPMVVHKSSGKLLGFGEDVLAEHGKKAIARTFAGPQILAPQFFQYLPKSKTVFDLKEVYLAALAAGEHVQTMEHSGLWYDLGSIPDYAKAHFEVLELGFSKPAKALYMSDLFKLKKFTPIFDRKRKVLQFSKSKNQLERSVVMANAKIASPLNIKSLKNIILHPHCEITEKLTRGFNSESHSSADYVIAYQDQVGTTRLV